MFGLTPTIISLIAPVLVSAWLFQAYWGVQTFADAKDDVKQGGNVSEWLCAGFATPVAVGGFFRCVSGHRFLKRRYKIDMVNLLPGCYPHYSIALSANYNWHKDLRVVYRQTLAEPPQNLYLCGPARVAGLAN